MLFGELFSNLLMHSFVCIEQKDFAPLVCKRISTSLKKFLSVINAIYSAGTITRCYVKQREIVKQ